MTTFASHIDINCDLGEGLDNDYLLYPYISSCNIACGGHAGDSETMTRSVALAIEHGVRIGAHPSYPDRKNFGRVSVIAGRNDLIDELRNQVDRLVRISSEAGAFLAHIKPHGALYNDLYKNPDVAELFLESMDPYKSLYHLYLPCGKDIIQQAEEKGFIVRREAFADRRYNDDLSLVSRTLPGALLNHTSDVCKQVMYMVKKGIVVTATGSQLFINPDTICIHGDHPNAAELARSLFLALTKSGFTIKA